MAAELKKAVFKGRGARALALISLAVGVGAQAALAANLKVAGVVAGSAQIQQSGADTIIHAANHTIINYSQFDIAAGTSVRFIQPSASSWVLNRIVTASPTQIEGTLTANGVIYLVDPAGVMFGKNSIINVGQLYAAAANISNQDALAGLNHFTGGQGSVINQGTITAGDVYLVGLHVVNGGSILGGSGTVAMVSGSDVYLSNGSGGLMVKIKEGASPAAASGVGVENDGNVAAQVADMSAGDLYSVAIRQTGRTTASNITLDGAGRVEVSGKLDASNADGVGGTVRVLGNEIALSGATIDASGETGGGTIWIGGGPHGSGGVATSAITLVDGSSSLEADAISEGNGGKVVVWSNQQTVFDGGISIRGGAISGNGGWAEVSSGDLLGFAGRVNASAPHGSYGTLLLDPHTITVASGGGAALTDVDSFSNTSDETIDAATIDAASANVVLQANTDIDINQVIDIPTSGISLTMQAGRSIVFEPGVSVTTTNGNILLSANDVNATVGDRDAGAATITMDSTNGLNAGNGNISLVIGSLGAGGALDAGTLTTTGNVSLSNSGGDVSALGNITCNVFSSSGANFSNAGTINAGGNVTINQTGVVTIGAEVISGGSVAVVSSGSRQIDLDFESNSTSPAVSSAGSQTYFDPVTLAADAALNSIGGNITFDSTVDGGFALTADAPGTTVFQGLVGSVTPLASLTTNDPGSNISGGVVDFDAAGTTATPSVTTTGGQTYNNAVVLNANAAFTDTGSSAITFDSSINGAFALTVNTGGTATFGGLVGGTTALKSVLIDDPSSGVSGGTLDLNESGTTAVPCVETTAGQTYNVPITLGANATLTDTGGGAITFNSTVDGAFSLTVNTAGETVIAGAVGSNTNLVSLVIDDSASGIVGGPVEFNFDGTADGPTVTTTAGQTYNSAVVLNNDTALNDTNSGTIAFGSTVNGAFALSVNTAGNTTFGGLLGGTTPLASVTTDDPNSSISGGTAAFNVAGTIAAPTVKTTGGQTYNTAIALGAATVLTDTGGSAISFESTVDGTFALTVNTAGNTTFGGLVGNVSPLASLVINDPTSGISGGTTTLSASGASSTAPSIATTGTQTFNNPVVLTADGQIITDGAAVTFNSTVNGDGNGPWNFGVATTPGTSAAAGNIEFNAAVGGVNELASLTCTANSETQQGLIIFDVAGSGPNVATVTTNAGQTYNDPVQLKANTELNDNGGGSIGFAGPIDGDGNGPWTLGVNTSFSNGTAGNIVFGNSSAAYVGAVHPLLSLTTTAAGSTSGNTVFQESDTTFASVTTLENQTYNNPVDLAANTALVATGDASGPGSVRFDSTIDGGEGLEVVASYTYSGAGALANANGGNIEFGLGGPAFIGTTTALSSLTTISAGKGTGSAGNTIFNIVGGTSVQSTGSIGFDNPVVLDADTTIKSTGGTISTGDTISGAFNLGVDTTGGGGNIVLEAAINVSSLTVTGGESIFVSDVTTTGAISLQPDSDTAQGADGPNDVRPSGVIILNGNLDSTSGDVELAPTGRTSVPSVATIADNPSTSNNVSITAQGLTMGPEEKITALGNLSINVGAGTATLGDINTGGSLSVTAGQVIFNLRPSGFLLTTGGGLASEAATNPPGGTDVVVLGPSLTFNTASITTAGSGPALRFASSSGKGSVPGFKVGLYSVGFGSALLGPGETPLDLQARAFTPETLATSLPPAPQAAVAGPNPYGPVSGLDLQEAFALFQGGSSADSGPPRGTAATFVEELQTMYCLEVSFSATGHAVYSGQIDPEKLTAIQKDFNDALNDYWATVQEKSIDPAVFEMYLERATNPGAVRTYSRLKRLNHLLKLVSDSNLSQEDQDRVTDAIIQPMRPNELSYDDMVQLIAVVGRPPAYRAAY
jgi:filamentous hemagglutinin family protein